MADGSDSDGQIDTVMKEKRLFRRRPNLPVGTVQIARRISELWHEAAADLEVLGRAGAKNCTGSSRLNMCSIWKDRVANWFVGGKTNVSYNCLDRI